MSDYRSNGSLNPSSEKLPSFFPVGGVTAASHPVKPLTGTRPSRKSQPVKPLTGTRPSRKLQQVQHIKPQKRDVQVKPRVQHGLKGRPVSINHLNGAENPAYVPQMKQKSSVTTNHLKASGVKKPPAYVPRINQNQKQSPQKQTRTQDVRSKTKQGHQYVGSATGPVQEVVNRQTTKDDELRAEMEGVRWTLCDEGYACQKFAFKPRVTKSKEIFLKLLEQLDKTTGKKDYRLFWSKPKKSFSILTELDRMTRGCDDAPVLQRNQAMLRQFTIPGKHALKNHCLSFHFRDRSLDLVFEHAETADSLEKFIEFLRAEGGLNRNCDILKRTMGKSTLIK